MKGLQGPGVTALSGWTSRVCKKKKEEIHCFEVQTCILITLPSRFFVCEVETVTAYSSQLRIAAGEGRKQQSEATRKAEGETERKGEKKKRKWATEKKITQEGV